MCDAFATEDGGDSKDYYFHIEPEGFSLEVFFFVGYFVFEGEFVAAVDLCPAGEAWFELVNAGIDAQLHEVVLVVECGAWAYKDHFAFDDVDEVGQFVEAEFAYEGAGFEQVFLWVSEQVGGDIGCVFFHAAEFVEHEEAVVDADAFLCKEYGGAVFK